MNGHASSCIETDHPYRGLGHFQRQYMRQDSHDPMTPVFTVIDSHDFVHWIETIPGVVAVHVDGKRYRLLFLNGIPSVRENHVGAQQPFCFAEELQVHLDRQNAEQLVRNATARPVAEEAL